MGSGPWRAHCSIPHVGCRGGQEAASDTGKANGDALMESPAQGHGESRQEEGAVGLTPEQLSGLWKQLHLGGLVVSGSTRDPSDL